MLLAPCNHALVVQLLYSVLLILFDTVHVDDDDDDVIKV